MSAKGDHGEPWDIYRPVAEGTVLRYGALREWEQGPPLYTVERIVACVNALDGIANPAAVKGVIAAARWMEDNYGASLDLARALAALDEEPGDE